MTLTAWIVLAVAVVVAFVVGYLVGGTRNKSTHTTPQETGETTPATTSAVETPDTAPQPPRRRAAIIYNPTKNEMDTLKSVATTVCRNEGWDEPLFIETTKDDPGTSMAHEAREKGAEVVIAAGGDGTVRAIAEALADTDVPMGIIPMGTGNLLARNLSIPLNRFEWAMRVALWGQDRVIDAARLRTSPNGEDTLFTVMAGIGYDATVMSNTSEDAKSRMGWWAYVRQGSRQLLGKPTEVRIQFDDGEEETRKIRSILGGNCGKVQGGIELIPGAVIDDGHLDVLTVTPRNVAEWVSVVTSIAGRSRKGMHADVTKCAAVKVRAEKELDVQVDGDVLGETDYLELSVLPNALTVRTPSPEQERHIRLDSLSLGMARRD